MLNFQRTHKAPWDIFFALALGLITTAIIFYAFMEFRTQRIALENGLALFDEVRLHRFVEDLDALCTRLGRAPIDNLELETLLGSSLPKIHDRGSTREIDYHRTSMNAHYLWYVSLSSGYHQYDSDQSERGWHSHSEG